MIVPKGLVAIFYDRDYFSSEINGVRAFQEGAYQLTDGDKSWNDRVVSMIV